MIIIKIWVSYWVKSKLIFLKLKCKEKEWYEVRGAEELAKLVHKKIEKSMKYVSFIWLVISKIIIMIIGEDNLYFETHFSHRTISYTTVSKYNIFLIINKIFLFLFYCLQVRLETNGFSTSVWLLHLKTVQKEE